jgi:hypothetical protein
MLPQRKIIVALAYKEINVVLESALRNQAIMSEHFSPIVHTEQRCSVGYVFLKSRKETWAIGSDRAENKVWKCCYISPAMDNGMQFAYPECLQLSKKCAPSRHIGLCGLTGPAVYHYLNVVPL